MSDDIVMRGAGLYCPAGDFYIDPMRPVARAIITHAHGDHARSGSEHYYASTAGLDLLRIRLGHQNITPLGYGQNLQLDQAQVSLHPAGHILGSAQVRIETARGVTIVTGDFKRAHDPTCAPFEVLPCDTLVTEATFAFPAYRFPKDTQIAAEIYRWWQHNRAEQRPSVVFAYALGKAQRVLALLTQHCFDTVLVHGAMGPLTAAYRRAGVSMLPVQQVSELPKDFDTRGCLALAPPSAAGSAWMRRFKHARTGFCSGWMQIRGNRRRRGYDRGFVLSDHADWPQLLATVRDTGARRVLCHHGNTDIIVRYLREQGIDAQGLGRRLDHAA